MCTAYGTCILRRGAASDRDGQEQALAGRVDGLEWAWTPILVM